MLSGHRAHTGSGGEDLCAKTGEGTSGVMPRRVPQRSAEDRSEGDDPMRAEALTGLERGLGNGDVSTLANFWATVHYGTVRQGHGLEIRLVGQGGGWRARVDERPGGQSDGRLDVHGDAVFRALPAGMGGVARMMLPLKIRLAAEREDVGTFRAQFVLGARKLSHARIDSLLQEMADAGDEPFVLEFRGPSDWDGKRPLLGFIPTRASDVQQSLALGTSIVYRGPLPPMRKQLLARALPWIRWWLCPALVALWCWVLLLSPEEILTRFPTIIPKYDSITSALPLHPTSMEQAFRLGVLHERLRAASGSVFSIASRGAKSILEEAEGVVGKGRGTAKIEELQNVLLEIQKIEASRGLTSRVAGFLTFVNIMWLVAICGIMVSIGPSIYSLLYPFRDFLRRLWRSFVDNVLLPVVTRLHRWGVLELAAYVVCMLLVAEGHRVRANGGEGGLFVSLTGALGYIPCFAYSTTLWAPKGSSNKAALALAAQAWLMLCWAPCAIAVDSRLYGYLTVAALYGALQSSVSVGNLVWCIGFRGKAALQRCGLCSLLLVTAFACARLWDAEQAYMKPFAQPAQVFGSVVGLLAMLIASSIVYDGHENHIRSNVVMALALVLTQSVGHVWGMTGMANVGTVMMVLWLMDKYATWHKNMKFDFYVLVLLNSTFVWRVSLYLHMHPEFVTRMMTL